MEKTFSMFIIIYVVGYLLALVILLLTKPEEAFSRKTAKENLNDFYFVHFWSSLSWITVVLYIISETTIFIKFKIQTRWKKN